MHGAIEAIYWCEIFRFNARTHELVPDGEARLVERQILMPLALLLTNRDRIVGKDEIVESIGDGRTILDGSIGGRAKLLRKVLDDDGKQQRLIKTYHGQGFRFAGTVKASDERHGASTTNSDTPPELPARPWIAVLPFDNMSPDPERGIPR